MKKILYISGTRADYGLMKEVLSAIDKHPNLKLEIAATGMHLMPEFGNTVKEIEKDGFKVHKIRAVYKKDDKESVVRFISEFILKLLPLIKKIKPDLIFVQGDRNEMLSGAIAGTYLGIPVVHSHGGETTGTIDETTRHAITKLSHIHLAPTKKAGERIIKMGENKKMVFVVGAPGLDAVLNKKTMPIAKKYGLDLSKPILLVAQHSVTLEIKEAAKQMKETMEAVKELGYQAIVAYPNADPGGKEKIRVIKEYRKYPHIRIYKNISHNQYLALMNMAGVMVGNSSAAIIEAPSFNLPAVNIGTRQNGREQASNVINVGYDKNQIKKAVNKALFDKRFREKVKKSKNPYGDGKTSKRIVDILDKLKIDSKLLNKKITY